MKQWATDPILSWHTMLSVMRLNECEKVEKTLTKPLGINLIVIGRLDLVHESRKGITDNPEAKQKFTGGHLYHRFQS